MLNYKLVGSDQHNAGKKFLNKHTHIFVTAVIVILFLYVNIALEKVKKQ